MFHETAAVEVYKPEKYIFKFHVACTIIRQKIKKRGQLFVIT